METEDLSSGKTRALVRQIRLRVVDGPDAGVVFEAVRERVVLGTDPSADFVLKDAAVSRFHCQIHVEEGTAVVTDLDSRNGTLVEGVAVLAARLKGGDVVTLGRTRVRFELAAERVEIPLSEKDHFGRMVGRSRPMRAVFATLERAAKSDATVVLLGETGTGKDLAAESIHAESARGAGPFVVVDCGAIPAGLMESELFGHEKGSFTGAHTTRAGAFEEASGGTLFLDEVGELSVELQPKLLRALEHREVQRVGSAKRTPVDVRVIAATNRNLRVEVNAHRFRADLYYRLAVIEVHLPPLREHREDIPDLVDAILESMDAKDSPAVRSAEFLDELRRHQWPGNIRELKNCIERSIALERPVPMDEVLETTEGTTVDPREPLRKARERWLATLEHQYLEQILALHGGNVSAAARAAGMDRVHFHRLLVRRGLR